MNTKLNKTDLSYVQWADAVDALCMAKLGVDTDSVGDWPSHYTYRLGATVAEGFYAFLDYHSDKIPTDLLPF